MPEGPEIKRAADALSDAIAGLSIDHVRLPYHRLRPFGPRFRGQRITTFRTHGKALLTNFDNGWTIYSHNQLYGLWQVARPNDPLLPGRALRLELGHQDRCIRLYSATDISLWRTQNVAQHPFLSRLGPDILDPILTPETLVARLQSTRFQNQSLGKLYLDQRFLAGVGNYLRSEILFRAGVNGLCKPNQLNLKRLVRLARQTLSISQQSYETGGITLNTRRVDRLQKAGADFEQSRFWVFDRAGLPCYQCAQPIQRTTMASRRLYTCLSCQTSL
ncbi:endonuclease VIII [Pseudomonadales bacterium]|nr:endonuclease VIII [Pseudomonadales bacterium]